jgi:hypothetical protein
MCTCPEHYYVTALECRDKVAFLSLECWWPLPKPYTGLTGGSGPDFPACDSREYRITLAMFLLQHYKMCGILLPTITLMYSETCIRPRKKGPWMGIDMYGSYRQPLHFWDRTKWSLWSLNAGGHEGRFHSFVVIKYTWFWGMSSIQWRHISRFLLTCKERK